MSRAVVNVNATVTVRADSRTTDAVNDATTRGNAAARASATIRSDADTSRTTAAGTTKKSATHPARNARGGRPPSRPATTTHPAATTVIHASASSLRE
jgi:hypothetical protein